MEKETTLISIIIPVYKVEKYLSRCLDSIVNQTYRNLEIILIDDGSPDKCPSICDEYAYRDERIKVVHKRNEGLAEVRNVGLAVATGDYVTFVDSDDFVSPNYVELLYNGVVACGADVSVVSCRRFSESDSFDVVCENSNFYEISLKNAIQTYASLNPDITFITAWGKLYKKSLFAGLSYPKGKLYEDSFTTYKLLHRSSKIVFSNAVCYYYFVREDSITGLKFSEKNIQAVDALSESISYFEHVYRKDVADMLHVPLLNHELYCWWGAKHQLNNEGLALELQKRFRNHCKCVLKIKEFPLKWKCIFSLFAVSPRVYSAYRRLFK